ncbi:MAG: Hsp20/alpha crystallin family protein [Leptolyngbya sp. SIO1E4]|nr:Hsp20/alpha crystallin family protein [Leptolyngbya sp. SIO1E4]
MTLVRWQPFREMQDVQREMNRLFEDMLTPSDRGDGFNVAFSPAAEIEETEDAYQLRLEVPGMEPNDISIEVTAEAVSIKGERKTETREEQAGVTRTEFRYGQFQRVIPLPGRIKNQDVSANYKNGILHLELPKAEEEKNRVVKVNIS